MKITSINPLLARANKEFLKVNKKDLSHSIEIARVTTNHFLTLLTLELAKGITGEVSKENMTKIALDYSNSGVGVWPGKGATYRKISNRAYEFLKSLDMPSNSLVDDFTDHLNKLPRVYEEFIETPNEHIWIIRNANTLIIYTLCNIEGQRILDFSTFTFDAIFKLFKDYKSEETLNKDSLGMVINLWMAEELNVITLNESEPKTSMRDSINICDEVKLKPNFNYRYIHITDSTWSKYEKAITATASRSDVEYKVPSWLVRAHFRRYNNVLVLVKAHYAYRKCGEIKDTELINLYV